jgi:hypothetical protein
VWLLSEGRPAKSQNLFWPLPEESTPRLPHPGSPDPPDVNGKPGTPGTQDDIKDYGSYMSNRVEVGEILLCEQYLQKKYRFDEVRA